MEEAGSRAGRDLIYDGPLGYSSLETLEHNGRRGALLYYANPDPRKLHAVDSSGLQELEQAVALLETIEFDFCIFYGAYDPLHAGADVTEFAGDPNIEKIRVHLHRGTDLDARVKALWPRMRTVSIIAGERFGGSVEWPLFAEYAVAAKPARIQLSEVQLGILPGWNGVLNVLIKSGPGLAKYMGATGNPLSAEQMLQYGIVQRVVDTPPAPDKSNMTPDDYLAAWAEHGRDCNELLLKAALELATGAAPAMQSEIPDIVSADELDAEINKRCEPELYRALKQEIAAAEAELDPAVERDQLKELGRKAAMSVAELGKPLAPAAVAAVLRFVDRWSGMSREELLAHFSEIGREEADACLMLMSTEHRRRGVNAVLSKSPAERVAVFD